MGTEWVGVLTTGITALGVLFFSFFAKTIYSIFKSGVNFKAKFVTKEEFDALKTENEELRKEIKAELRSYKGELERTVLSTTKAIIDREMRHISVMDEKMDKFNESYIAFSTTSDWMKERYNELNTLSDELIDLKKRVAKIEYDDDTNTSRRIMK